MTARTAVPRALHLAVLLSAAAAGAPAIASEAISQKAGCAVCHGVDKRIVGPTYKEIAAKYKGDPKAAALLAERVRKGSQGVWGSVPMVATPPDKLSDADLKAVVDWILKR